MRRLSRSTSARSSRTCACARRAARRHLLCRSQAATPPTTTPPITSSRISANRGSERAKAGCAWSNGSNETVTVWRFATAKVTTTIASGTRISAVTILRIMVSGDGAIEPLAHFLAGLEERHRFLLHRDMGAGARIAAGAGRTVLDGESAEAAQLDAVAAGHGRDDLAEDGVDDVLHVSLIEMRVLRRDALHELGFDHRCCRPDLNQGIVRHRRVPQGQQTVKVE